MNTATATAIQTAVGNILAGARVGVTLGAMSPAEALDIAARNAVENATQARTRGGHWAHESTPAQIEEALFHGSVGRDILEGNVRPSTGNVRTYALAELARTIEAA